MDRQAPVWALYLLGTPRLERSGHLVEMDTRKALALLAYLTLTETSHSRESLAALFWPEYDQSSARGALRRTLSTLHKATGGIVLDIARERIRIHTDSPLWVDVLAFRQLISKESHATTADSRNAQQTLQQAVDLYTGDFLQGFTLRDSPAFDDWQYFQTDSLRRELAGALERLALIYTTQLQDTQAILSVRRWLAMDELQEAAQRWLMKLYAWAGQRGTALRQYRECVRVLEQELGVPPLTETTQLYQAILENQLPARPLAEPPARVEQPVNLSAPEDYPLTGRDAELGQLQNIYWTGSGRGALVLIEGEAGVGKTRLAEEILRDARQAGAVTLTARCYEGETQLAYGPFLEGIQSLLNLPSSLASLEKISPHWLSEAARLAPDLTRICPDLPTPPASNGPGSQSRFFEGVRQLLMGLLSGNPPGILFLDDLHWADSATLDLLFYMVRRLRGHAVLVMLTWRERALSADVRIKSLVTDALRSGYGFTIPLKRLTTTAVIKLAGQSAQSISEEQCLKLFAETEGLPLLVTSYLDTIKQRGTLPANADWEMPDSVRSLLRSRLPAPDEPSWQLLTTAAVIGHAFDFDTLRQASGRSELETVSGLETLLTLGLIREQGESDCPGETRYGFTHEKLHHLVYEEISLARLRLLHQRVAEALAAGRAAKTGHTRLESGHLAARIAQHYRSSGQDTMAAEYYQQAGDYARQLFANQEALAHYQAALALSPSQPATLYEAMGDLHVLEGDYPTAIRSYETAAALLSQAELPGIEHKLGNIHGLLGEWELAECHYLAALEGLPDPASQAWAYADWSRTTFRHGEPARALELANKSLDLAQISLDARALVQAHNIMGILERNRGALDDAATHLEQGLQLAEASGDLSMQAAALNNLALIRAAQGDPTAAIPLAQQALELCLRQGDRHRAAALHNNLADFLHELGEEETAMQHLKQAATLFSEIEVDDQALKPEIWKLTEW